MAKTRRVEFRLDESEYAILQANAGEMGVSEYLRKVAGLKEGPASLVRGVVEFHDRDAQEIKRLAMQRHGHLPLAAAERAIRQELG